MRFEIMVQSGGSLDGFVQLITVLIIFIVVLAAALFTSKWIAGYQKQHKGKNIDIIETAPLGTGKYLQIVKIAKTYVAIAVCKDTVTVLATLPEEDIEYPAEQEKPSFNFRELFQKAKENENEKDIE